MAENPPYLASPGTATKALEKIKAAATPERFTTDFVHTVLGIKGGQGNALIPFFKRMGLVKSDGAPTELYHKFRNPTSSGQAAAHALKIGYKTLYERNEYIHKASDDDLKGVVLEVTGLHADNAVAKLIVSTFKGFKAFCNFDSEQEEVEEVQNGKKSSTHDEDGSAKANKPPGLKLNLAYSINLHLPASDDIKVFDAIFKSLKENLLKD